MAELSSQKLPTTQSAAAYFPVQPLNDIVGLDAGSTLSSLTSQIVGSSARTTDMRIQKCPNENL